MFFNCFRKNYNILFNFLKIIAEVRANVTASYLNSINIIYKDF